MDPTVSLIQIISNQYGNDSTSNKWKEIVKHYRILALNAALKLSLRIDLKNELEKAGIEIQVKDAANSIMTIQF